MEPKNYIHKFYKDASWSQSVMNKIMPKQNTSIQNNFWIIQVATKGRCWKLLRAWLLKKVMARIGEWKEWDVGYFEGNHLQQSKNKKDRERRVTELIPNLFIIIPKLGVIYNYNLSNTKCKTA